MSKVTSSYYPPRARWYAPVFYFFNAVQRRIALDRIHLPPSVTWLGLCGCFLVPGFGFYLRGPRILGRLIMSVSALLFMIFIVWLGYPFANIAFGLMVSAHVSGIVYYCDGFLRQWEFMSRIGFTILALVGVGFSFYAPLRGFIQDHWLMPVQMNGHVIILAKAVSPDNIHRGDYVGYMLSGYRFSNHMGNGVMGDTHLGLGPVLAVAGDHVEFSSTNLLVNGVPQPLLPQMPHSGSLDVAQHCWFIWPTLNISGNWTVGADQISGAMLQLANVSENQYVGKPLKHWFRRKQILP
jgi:hypothetical protein